ncbi:MAG TPA: bifunctional phosphoglucose/phosphomannose isomerase [Dehalococcoidia bacterium]|nr:bifunctional phosphoglucose/phosphomannose isomerase [Dehalococcoidia bacterium]
MDVLDDLSRLPALDPGGMLESIRDLPRQCRRAWQEAQGLHLPDHYRPVRGLAVLGMGGSAIAGDYLRSLGTRLPVGLVRSYDLPPWVDSQTLAVASSYSGNTEETLSACQQALERGARVVVITGGGRLGELARERGLPLFTIGYRAQPRAALGYSLMPLLRVAHLVGALDDPAPLVEEALSVMEAQGRRLDATVPTPDNPAKSLALRLHGRLVVVFGAGPLAEAAHRFKTQVNENAKAWAFYEELPEADHNAVVAFARPEAVARHTSAVFLHSPRLHPRVLLRYEFTRQTLEEAGVECHTVAVPGEGPLAVLLAATLLADYVSFYLALLNGVDPTPVPEIERLKAWLAQR